MEFSEIKSQVKTDDYKVDNYDHVKSERDNLEHDRLDVQRQLTILEGAHQTLQKERDELHSDLIAAKQSLSLLKQDKDYLTKQVSDLTNRCTYAEEKLQQINMQLDDAKRSREEMYEKYVSSRDQYKTEYENKLKEELEQIRTKTNSEIDRLRTSTREMYERENRNLREARDMSISEKDRAVNSEREMSTKYEQLMTQFRELQLNGDNKVVELQNDLKLKGFEVERTQMVHEETVRNVKESKLEIEKLQKKIEVLTKEYYGLQTSTEKRVVELESDIADKKAKLDSYEKVEKELDDIVLQAAEVDDDTEAEKVLFSYGYGANVPSTSKRRLQQSVHLARRVLQLEKINSNLKKDLDTEKVKIRQLAEELKNSNSILDQAQQPYNYLIESIRQRDNQIQKQKAYTSTLESDVQKLSQEREELVRTKNQMSLDLERLLNQREEMSVVMNLSTRKYGEKKTQSKDLARPKSPKSLSVHLPAHDFETYDEPNVVKPGSISLVMNDKHIIVVALDFGTSYSGYAYSTLSDFKKDPNTVYVNQACNAGGYGLMSSKTPTCLLLDKKKDFVAFGYDAENEFVNLAVNGKQASYYFFQRFKMKLYQGFLLDELLTNLYKLLNNLFAVLLGLLYETGDAASYPECDITPEMTVTEIGGKTCSALDVFALSIKALINDFLDRFKKGHSNVCVTIKDIRWVLTVPAIWSEKAKQFMRRAAKKAGIPDGNLLIALEPECASVYCQYLRTEQMQGADRDFKASEPGTKYMIVDLGGGTADIAVHEKMRGHQLKEICRATGGNCGGTSVDIAFLEFLEDILGDEALKEFKRKDPESFLMICRNFETAKRKVKSSSNGKMSVTLPYVPLSELCQSRHKKSLEDVIQSSDYCNKVCVSKGHLRIDASIFRKFFEKTLETLTKVLSNLFDDERVKTVNNIILVGGFSECELVQETIKAQFPEKSVIVPEECGLAVLKGAVMYGHKPAYISKRVMPFTYGINITEPFDPEVHKLDHKVVVNGKEYCRNVFLKIVERDSEVEVDTKIVKRVSTVRPYQNLICVNTYMSKEKNPKYVDDAECVFLGNYLLKIPHPTEDTSIAGIEFTIGNTEISIHMENADSDDKYEGYFDLLSIEKPKKESTNTIDFSHDFVIVDS